MSGIAENARRNSRRASSAAVSNNNFHVSGSNLKLERRKKTFTVNYLYPVHREKDTLINSFSTFFQGHEKEFFPNGAPIGLKEFQSMLDDVEFSSEGMSKSIMINLISLLLMNSGAQDYLKLTYQQTQFFVDSVACNYNEPAFHRFEHAFCVTQMAYCILHKTGLFLKLSNKDKIILLISCLSHDIDHQGLTNPYHVRNSTPLAEMYNNTCPMENHHAAVINQILKAPQGILQNLEEIEAKKLRDTVTTIILATDMEKHSSILQRASEIETSDPNYNLALLQVIMKAADLSNELRSPTVAYSWIHRMYDELNSQMRDEGLPTLPTDPLFIAKDQIQFINTKILPIYKQLNLMANNGAQFFLQRIQKALRRHQMILDNAEKNENENSDSLGASKSKRNT